MDTRFDLAIAVIGEISSGKSTLAARISKQFDIPILKFSDYLRRIAAQQHLDVSRETLQELGDSLIAENSDGFLKDAINSISPSKTLIFDGVRHESVFTGIRHASIRCLAIFMDVNYEERLSRWLAVDPYRRTRREFDDITSHPVEQGITSLKQYCSLIVDTHTDFNHIVNHLIIN